MKKALLALAVAGATLSAQADTKLYGHVAYNIRDTDGTDDVTFNRHSFSESRFGIKAGKKLKSGLKVFSHLEFGIQEGENNITTVKVKESSAGVDLNDDADTTDTVTTGTTGGSQLRSRVQSFGFSGSWGKVALGQHSDVGDGVLNADLAGTALVNPLASNGTAAAGLGLNGFDPGRGESLQYFSPKLGGIATIALQLQESGGTEIALKANTNGFRFNAFSESGGEKGGDDLNDNQGFLIGYKAPFGLSLTYQESERTFGKASSAGFTAATVNDTKVKLEGGVLAGTKLKHQGWKVGYAFGKHKVSYSAVEYDEIKGLESTGLAYLYNMAKGVQLWANWKEIDAGAVGTVDAIGLGGRVKF